MLLLNLIDVSPCAFFTMLQNTADVEILSMIGKLMVETKTYFADGIPKYGKNMTLDQKCIEAKKELLACLLNEYQIRASLSDIKVPKNVNVDEVPTVPQKFRIAKATATAKPFGGLPLGNRYPQSKRKLSDKDIQSLDTLFHTLNKSSRGDKNWDSLCKEINKILGYECVG